MKRHYLPSESFNIRGAIYEVYKHLGPGFLESVYHEALTIEFDRRRIPFKSQSTIAIKYKDVPLSKHFIADFICYSKVIIEIKAVKEIDDIHRAQVFNYLKATGLYLGLLVNFYSYPGVHIERYIHGIPEYQEQSDE